MHIVGSQERLTNEFSPVSYLILLHGSGMLRDSLQVEGETNCKGQTCQAVQRKPRLLIFFKEFRLVLF